jgi:hypothetical protein
VEEFILGHVELLAHRASERASLADRFDELARPDEATGIYSGEVLWALDHYFVQRCGAQVIRHDQLLLEGVREIAAGQSVTIAYKYNGPINSDSETGYSKKFGEPE